MAVSAETKIPEKNKRSLPRMLQLLSRRGDGTPIEEPVSEEPDIELPESFTYFELMTYHFVKHFPETVSAIDVSKVLVPTGMEYPRSIDAFSLASLIPDSDKMAPPYFWKFDQPRGGSLTSLDRIGRGYEINPKHYRWSDIYLDSAMAIGLGYGNEIAGVAAGGITDDGRLRITQIQGIQRTYGSQSRERYKNNGLHAGIKWRESLVNAWLEVAKLSGISEVEIQGAKNNTYWTPPEIIGVKIHRFHHDMAKRVNENLIKGYDELAQRMGFSPTPEGNWVVEIT